MLSSVTKSRIMHLKNILCFLAFSCWAVSLDAFLESPSPPTAFPHRSLGTTHPEKSTTNIHTTSSAFRKKKHVYPSILVDDIPFEWVVTGEQYVPLIDPDSAAPASKRHQFIVIEAKLSKKSKAPFSKKWVKQSFDPLINQQLAANTCITFYINAPSSNPSPSPLLSKTCAESFVSHWSNQTSSVVCGARWVPKGGKLGDRITDAIGHTNRSDKLVFRLTPDLITEMKKVTINLEMGLKSPAMGLDQQIITQRIDKETTEVGGDFEGEEEEEQDWIMIPDNLLSNYPATHRDVENSTSSSGEPKRFSDGEWQVAKRSLQGAGVNMSKIRICYYPSRIPRGDVYPKDIGQLKFVRQPEISLAKWASVKVPVRVFLEAGWSFDISVGGSGFDPTCNYLSLKLWDCTGFYDSSSFHFSRPTSVDSETARFEMSSDYRVEAADLPLWRRKYLTNRYGSADFNDFISPYSTPFPNSISVNKHDSIGSSSISTSPTPRSPHREASNELSTNRESSMWSLLSEAAGILNEPISEQSHGLSQSGSVIQDLVKFSICFYSNSNEYNGTAIGSALFIPDHHDAAELVGIIIFSIVGVPFLCGTTISCYSYRHRKLRRKFRRIRLQQQREEVERRLLQHLNINDDEDSSNEIEDPTSPVGIEVRTLRQP